MALTTHAAPAAPHRVAARAGFRPDIQALRALAIALVVGNHLWPERLTGGYVGVDVFFVISGFLITAHLWREVAETGRVRFGAFYARRARRLLPAALLVLAIGAVATWVWLPASTWLRSAAEITASAFYGENWALAAMAVDYHAINDSATIAQHYWSLSVEEQFYLLWPLAILAAWACSRRLSLPARRTVLLVLAGLGAVSLVASALFTAASPQQAYFTTFTRAWEFAAGALIALVAHRIRLKRMPSELLAYAGFALVAVSAFAFDAATPFPGTAALVPVLGTAMVILAGSTTARPTHELLTGRRPVQWLGDVSYSLYLWHWPLIVVAPFVLGHTLGTLDKAAILVVSLVLAGLTRRLVEVPGQRWTALRVSARRSLLAAGAGMLAIGVLAGGLAVAYANAPAMSGAIPIAAPHPKPCEGPNALTDAACDAFSAPPADVTMGPRNVYYSVPTDCTIGHPELDVDGKASSVTCDFSKGAPDAPTAWIVGDSHAQQWQWAIFDIARAKGWKLTTSFLGGCPPADVAFTGYGTDHRAAFTKNCTSWSHTVAAVIEREAPDYVFTSSFTREQHVDDGSSADQQAQFTDGFRRYWDRWTSAGATVLVIGDPPLNGAIRDPACLSLHAEDPLACAADRSVAQPADPLLIAAEHAGNPAVHAVDVTPYFCDTTRCYVSVGAVPVYYDADHLNLEYVRMLRPAIERGLTGTASAAGN